MKTLKDLQVVEGLKVLVRADFNVPIQNGKITDDFRIKKTLPTVDFLSKNGAVVILISHLESNQGENASLAPVADHLSSLGIKFIHDWKNANAEIAQAKPGSIFLLENLRSFAGEKENDQKFAKELATLADVYVNDAFSVSHREHASIVSVPKYLPSYAGSQLEKEISHLSKAFNPAHPFLFILGGAKFETKLPLIEKFTKIADTVVVAGALSNDLYKAKGYEVGASLTSHSNINFAQIAADPKILIPTDVTVQDKSIKSPDSLSKTDKIMDAGPATIDLLTKKIAESKFILWNGTLGLYEDGFVEPTQNLARLIASSNAETIVGGGDTLSAISSLNLEDKFTFVSTGGGAMLDFLIQGTLVGIEALN